MSKKRIVQDLENIEIITVMRYTDAGGQSQIEVNAGELESDAAVAMLNAALHALNSYVNTLKHVEEKK